MKISSVTYRILGLTVVNVAIKVPVIIIECYIVNVIYIYTIILTPRFGHKTKIQFL